MINITFFFFFFFYISCLLSLPHCLFPFITIIVLYLLLFFIMSALWSFCLDLANSIFSFPSIKINDLFLLTSLLFTLSHTVYLSLHLLFMWHFYILYFPLCLSYLPLSFSSPQIIFVFPFFSILLNFPPFTLLSLNYVTVLYLLSSIMSA